jgi:hypothetical protein
MEPAPKVEIAPLVMESTPKPEVPREPPAPPPPAPAPTAVQHPPAPRPLPDPVPVAPPLPAPPAPKLELAADAFPALVQPRSYLPPELEHQHERAHPPEHVREHVREYEREYERSNPLAEFAPPMPVASRRASGGRPVLVGAGALALVVVGYLFLTSSRPASQVAAESAPAVEQSKPAAAPAEEENLPPEDTDVPVSQPSAITNAPARSGPPSQAWSSSSGATAPLLPTGAARQSGADDGIVAAPSIAPPPANVELSVPKLPDADSLAPKTQRDTAALKRILKAVGGQ